MKKLNLILIALVINFMSCDNVKDEAEKLIENQIQIEETVEEEFSIPVVSGVGEQEPIVIPIDVAELTAAIEDQGNDVAAIGSASIEDVQIAIPEGSDANFDFLESAELIISSGEFAGTVIATIDDIPEGATVLDLVPAEGAADLVELIESGDFDITINFTTDEELSEPLTLELISEFLIGIDVEL